MASAAIAHANLADLGSISASTAETLMPVSRLQGEHVSQRWRSTAEPANVTLTLSGDLPLDTIALLGLTVGSTATIRVRVSTSAGGSTAGNLHDVTYSSADEEFDPDYGALIVVLPASVSGRYVRFDITDTPASYVEAGRLSVGLREALAYNFTPGSSRTWTDRSRKSKTSGGQTLIWPDNKFRSVDLSFDFLSEAQREGLMETIDMVNGQSVDVLLILDTASDNLARDSIWGLITEPSAILYTPIADIFSRQFRIEERL